MELNFWKKRKTVAVHSGNFHADDVFSVATLSLYLGYIPKIIRTRETEKIQKADYILDVGCIYDPLKNRFDHHQVGGAGERLNGIPYATFGLIWKELGEKITGSKEVAEIIEKKLVTAIDADDNAMEACGNFVCDARPYTISDFVIYNNFNCAEKKQKKVFRKLVDLAREIIIMEIEIAQGFVEDHKKVEAIYLATEDKRLILLDQDYDWNGILSDHPEPLFVIKPDLKIKAWKIYAVKIKGEKFKNRVDLPKSWASKKDQELARITGVDDAVYCHHQRYMAIAKSKEGAIELAQLALNLSTKLEISN